MMLPYGVFTEFALDEEESIECDCGFSCDEWDDLLDHNSKEHLPREVG